MRLTRQREVLLQAVKESKSHPDADSIYHLLKPQYPELSLGTVYRNLNVLSQAGMITKLTTPFSKEHYDGNTHPHYHLCCEVCQKIMDLDTPYKTELDREIQQNTQFLVREHEIVFHGICEFCQKEKGQEKV
jgi:Fur family peroxide stress response transcriptional regulator